MKYRKYDEYHKIVNGVEQKQCQDCLNWFDMNLNNFGLVTKNPDEFNHRCKTCQKIHQHNYYLKDRDNQISKAKKYREEHSQQIKDYRYVYNRESSDIIKKYNKLHHSTHKEEMRKNQIRFQNSESGKEKLKQYNKNRQQKNHKINKREWDSCKEYFNNKCAYCGLSIKEHFKIIKGELVLQDLHKEHVIWDGENDLSNCVPSCQSCNSQKWKSSLDEWYNEDNPIFDINKLNKIKQWLIEDWKQFYEEKKQRAAYGSRKKKEVSSN